MIQHIIFIILLFFITTPAYSISVEEAVDYAKKNNPELKALRLEEPVSKGRLEKAMLPLASNPVIESSISRKSSPQEGGERFTDYGVKLSQEIEIAGQRGVRIEMARKESARTDFEIRDRERTLIYAVKDTFAGAIAAKKRVDLTGEVVRLKEELLGFTNIKFQAGDVSGLDINLAEVELSKAKKDLLLAEREYRESLIALQGTIGLTSTSLVVEGDLPSEVLLPFDKEAFRKLAHEHRPDLMAVSAEAGRTEAALKLANKEAVPNITVSGFYERDERRNIAGIGFSIPLPLFDRKQAERHEASARAKQAEINTEGLKNAVEREFEQAFSALASAAKELLLFKKEILARASENLGLINLAFKEGKIGFFDVRLAQKDTIETQFAYLNSQLRAQLALNAMERAIGGSLK